MCILFVYTDKNNDTVANNSDVGNNYNDVAGNKGKYRIILISNRDEYYARPANVLSAVNEHVIGGTDMEPGREGGMWLGVSTRKIEPNVKLRIGAVLNLAGKWVDEDMIERGSAVVNYLNGDLDADEYVKSVLITKHYKPLHFVAVEIQETNKILCYCNMPKEYHTRLGGQCMGFSNTAIDGPYKKVEDGCKAFQEIVEKYNDVQQKDELVAELMKLLKSTEKHMPDPVLKKCNSEEVYEFLSSICVYSKDINYGTRAHSIILVDYDGNVEFIENSMQQPIDEEDPVWLTNNMTVKYEKD